MKRKTSNSNDSGYNEEESTKIRHNGILHNHHGDDKKSSESQPVHEVHFRNSPSLPGVVESNETSTGIELSKIIHGSTSSLISLGGSSPRTDYEELPLVNN